ncbi:MAG: hypothetical protein ACI3ZS_10090 [Candidatus Cryptobacteroides sp.]
MKRLSVLSIILSVVLATASLAASRPSSGTILHLADTVVVASDKDMIADSLRAALDSAFMDTTSVQKVRDRGYDATRYSMMKRFRPKNQEFISGKFMDNTFISINARSMKLATADYSFGMLGGLSFGKWFNPFCAVRLSANAGTWTDNFNGSPINGGEITADYLFNLVSYLDGYRLDRFCELSILAGLGYAGAGYKGHWGNAFTGHVGLNLALRIFPGVDFFIEPRAALYSNGMALSHAGNWRAWLASFQGDFGFTYNIGTAKRMEPRPYPWFVSLSGGLQVQNSMIVRDNLGALSALGMHYVLSGGKFFTRYFALRASLSYGRSKWVEYKGYLPYFTDYYSLRFEGLVDFVSLISKRDDNLVAASLLFGPEMGYMHKADIKDDVNRTYIGLSGAVQVRFRLWEGLGIFLEPRFCIVPYSAVANTETILNDYRNYYDGLICLNLGLEYRF